MTNESFQILDEREHALKRPAILIGSTTLEETKVFINGKEEVVNIVPGLLKIINEILDNSIDEYIRTDGKFANKIEIEFNKILGSLTEVSIKDNGRGIPIKKIGEHYIPELAWTRARAGSNFGEDAIRETMGMNGVGSFATNVFSKSFIGTTCDGSCTLVVECSDNAKNIEVKRYPLTKEKYTKVVFQPDFSRFDGIDEITEDHVKIFKERLYGLSISHPGLVFIFNGEKIQISVKDFAKKFGEEYLLVNENPFTAVLSISQDEEFHLVSYVNGLSVSNGGSHVDTFMVNFIQELRPLISKKYKIDVLPNHIRQHITLGIVVRKFKNPKFDSQTKERLTNSVKEVNDHYQDIDFKKIAKQFMSNEKLILPVIEAILYKKELADKIALAKSQKNIKKKRVVNHIEAQSSNVADKILYVTEGQSAIGQLLNVRDPKKVGGYPLKGKVMNTNGMKPSEIVKNKELSELMSIIGLEFGKTPNLNYGKIAILTDADVDGGHIACLLVNFFTNWKELFLENRIVRVETPYVVATKGKNKKIFYSLKEYHDDKLDSSWNVEFYKGLGSLPKEIYKDVINNPRIIPIEWKDSDQKYIDMAFGSNSEDRKKWLLDGTW